MGDASITPETLRAKVAEATQQYALKNYAAAADFYSAASVMQAELNGEMAVENADLLYAYGRCLYHVAVGKSDVLGGKVVGSGGGGDRPRGKKRKVPAGEEGEKLAAAAQPEKQRTREVSPEKKKDATTPYFQIDGDDADWDSDNSDGEDAGSDVEADEKTAPQPEEEEEEEEEDDDDFSIAYEILDTARVLFLRKIKTLNGTTIDDKVNGSENTTSKRKTEEPMNSNSEGKTPELRRVQELLADTYDLQSEISLENERFAEATVDSKASLALKQALYPIDSSIIAEAHFKVSLALEFGAKTTTEKPDELDGGGREEIEGVDEEMRKESARHMELAIESTRLRVEREKKELAGIIDSEDKEKRRRGIEDVKEMIADMEQRLHDLRAPTLSLSTAGLSDPFSSSTSVDAAPLRGILGSLLGETPAAQRAQIEEATKNANDLTSMIRHKKKAKEVNAIEPKVTNWSGGINTGMVGNVASNGKRKAIEDDISSKDNGKRARVEDVDEADELA